MCELVLTLLSVAVADGMFGEMDERERVGTGCWWERHATKEERNKQPPWEIMQDANEFHYKLTAVAQRLEANPGLNWVTAHISST